MKLMIMASARGARGRKMIENLQELEDDGEPFTKPSRKSGQIILQKMISSSTEDEY